MRTRLSASALVLGLMLTAAGTGCSTITRGGKQTVRFETTTPGATVHVGEHTLTTPAEVKLSRKKTYDVLVSAPGYQAVQFQLKPFFDGISLGNLIYPGGSAGLITDFLTGADKKFNTLAKIDLKPLDPDNTTQPSLAVLREHKGKLLTREQLAEAKGKKPATDDRQSEPALAAAAEEKLAADQQPATPTTQPMVLD